MWRKPRKKALFSSLQLVNLKEASHESFVFTSSTLGIWRKFCTKACVLLFSVFADCNGMAASRLLLAAVRVVNRIVMAAWDVWMVKKQQIFWFGIDDFPFKVPFKTRFKIVVFFALASRSIRFWSCKITAICVVHSSIVFCNSVSADRSGMAASRLLLAAAACVILLRFAAESRKSKGDGNVRRVNGEKAANFLVWHWWFSF